MIAGVKLDEGVNVVNVGGGWRSMVTNTSSCSACDKDIADSRGNSALPNDRPGSPLGKLELGRGIFRYYLGPREIQPPYHC